MAKFLCVLLLASVGTTLGQTSSRQTSIQRTQNSAQAFGSQGSGFSSLGSFGGQQGSLSRQLAGSGRQQGNYFGQQGSNNGQTRTFTNQQGGSFTGPQTFSGQQSGSYNGQQFGRYYGQQSGSFGGQRSGNYGSYYPGQQYGGYYDHFEPANYEFLYQVTDPQSQVNFGHLEHRHGDNTQGSYHVLLPDGRTQQVDYTADQSGYRPVITYHDNVNSYYNNGYYGDSGNRQSRFGSN